MWINHNVEYTRFAKAKGMFHRAVSGSSRRASHEGSCFGPEKQTYRRSALPKALSFFGTAAACILFSDDFPVEQVIFCPTHKYKRKPLEKSTPIPYPDRRN